MAIEEGKTYRRIDGILRKVLSIECNEVYFEWWNPVKGDIEYGHAPYKWFEKFTVDEYKETDSTTAKAQS